MRLGSCPSSSTDNVAADAPGASTSAPRNAASSVALPPFTVTLQRSPGPRSPARGPPSPSMDQFVKRSYAGRVSRLPGFAACDGSPWSRVSCSPGAAGASPRRHPRRRRARRPPPRRHRSSPRRAVERAHCPAALEGCREATGRVLYVEAVDPDGDGDAHFVLAGGRITAPGISAIAVRRELRPRPLPGVGDWVSAAGVVWTGRTASGRSRPRCCTSGPDEHFSGVCGIGVRAGLARSRTPHTFVPDAAPSRRERSHRDERLAAMKRTGSRRTSEGFPERLGPRRFR